MKKSLFFVLAAVLFLSFSSAQVYPPSQGTVVTESLMGLWNIILGILIWIGKYLLYLAALSLGLSLSQTPLIIISSMVWIVLLIAIARIMNDFTLFSKPIAWIISFALTILFGVLGVTKSIGQGLFSMLLALSLKSTIQVVTLAIFILILIYIIVIVIIGKFSSNIKRRKKEERKVKEEAGRKSLEKIGEEFGK